MASNQPCFLAYCTYICNIYAERNKYLCKIKSICTFLCIKRLVQFLKKCHIYRLHHCILWKKYLSLIASKKRLKRKDNYEILYQTKEQGSGTFQQGRAQGAHPPAHGSGAHGKLRRVGPCRSL